MLLIFTNEGKILWKNVYQLPKGTRLSKGRAIQNLFEIDNNVHIQEIISLRDFDNSEFLENHYLIFCTRRGIVKKTALKAFSRPMSKGIYAININEGDELISVQMTDGNHDIIIAAHNGKAIRFHEKDIRPMGRTATGVKGISLSKNDFAIGMVSMDPEEMHNTNLLVVSSKGYGKKSSIDDNRITKRGGKGIKTINITSKTGLLTSIENVKDDDELLITNSNNISIRFSLTSIRTVGRNTQGVRLIKLDANTEVISIARLSVLTTV
jgi:DNA gyrase subunit A